MFHQIFIKSDDRQTDASYPISLICPMLCYSNGQNPTDN